MSKQTAKNWEKPNPQSYIVQMENLTSEEVYRTEDDSRRPVLFNNTFDIRRGETWGIVGKEPFEVELLLQIIGCVRPYGSGKCKLVERGMMRKKRKILPHVFFVGDSGMAVPNMSVLEYLMFATRYVRLSAKERQTAILQAMLDSGCYEWCFAPIKLLSAQERAVLSLFAASYSDSLLIIFPYFYAETPAPLRGMIAHISRALAEKHAAFLIGTCDAGLVQEACSHSAFLLNGSLRQHGTLEHLTEELDHRDFILRSAEPQKLQLLLAAELPDFEIRVRENDVDIYHRQREPLSQREMLEVLARVNAPFDTIRKSRRTLANAFSEACNDLSDQLL